LQFSAERNPPLWGTAAVGVAETAVASAGRDAEGEMPAAAAAASASSAIAAVMAAFDGAGVVVTGVAGAAVDVAAAVGGESFEWDVHSEINYLSAGSFPQVRTLVPSFAQSTSVSEIQKIYSSYLFFFE
jgi:hypothetical protein